MEDKQTNLNCQTGTKRLKRSFLGNPKMLSWCRDPDIKCNPDKGRGNPTRCSQKVILTCTLRKNSVLSNIVEYEPQKLENYSGVCVDESF